MHIPYISNKKIDQDWLDKIAKEIEYTPDAPELARCEHHHLFVIDDLQRGRKYHNVLSSGGATWIATAFTEAQFHCWKRLPDVPTNVKEELSPIQVAESLVIPLPKKDQLTTTEWVENNKHHNRYDHWAKIIGELWKVPSDHFYLLDKFMENGKVFRRRRIALEVPLRMLYRNGDSTHIERIISEQGAYMYIGIPEFWEPQIDGGYLFQPMTIYSRSSLTRKYYCYTKLED